MKNDWDKELNKIGRKMNKAEEQKNDRLRFVMACIELVIAVLVILDLGEGSVLAILLNPVIAGTLLGFVISNLQVASPRYALPALVVYMIILVIHVGSEFISPTSAVLLTGILSLLAMGFVVSSRSKK